MFIILLPAFGSAAAQGTRATPGVPGDSGVPGAPGVASVPDEPCVPDSIETARIISYLAGDGLRGRASFTDGNEKAAAFIAAEFRGAGLVPMEGEDSIAVRFPVNRRRPVSAAVALNGVALPDTGYVVYTRQTALDIRRADSLPDFRMGETFDRSLMRKRNGIVLVPRVHEEMFGRYRRFMSRPAVFSGGPGEDVLVALLTDEDTVEALSVTYSAVAETPTLVDVVGVLPGKRPGEVVLFSAHYDHLGVITPVGGDSIANGANDNASGTTALIGLSKYFASLGTPERTVIFAAFAAEEIGGFGSRFLAEKIDPETIVAMLNIEMVGTVSKFGPASYWITGFDRSDLGAIVAAELNGTGYSAYPDPYPEQNLFFRSDNATFARKGVPAHSISTDPIDIDSVYHTVDDELGRLDVGHLSRITGGIALGVRGIVEGRQTPVRIKNNDN